MRTKTLRNVGRLCFATLLAIAATDRIALAQLPQQSAASPASYERTTEARSVRFNRRLPEVGDQMEQTLAMQMSFDTVVRQGNEVFNRGKMSIERRQRRQVTTTEVDSGMPVAAVVRYLAATKQSAAGPADEDLQSADVLPQPVAGKAYRCRRDEDKLIVTDEAGSIPPLDEFEIVAANMDSLGRTNPLARFLTGRAVSIGQQLELPNDVAEKLLGLGDELGQVSQFTLRLDDIRDVHGATCAVFHASIDAASTNSTQMRLQVEGPLVVQADTCRAVHASFSGPIGMSETRGSLSATFQMTATGRMRVDITSTYRDVEP